MEKFMGYLLDEESRPDEWADIYAEYIGLRENKSSLFVLGLMREIVYLKTKNFIINKCCEVLAVAPSPELIAELKAYGFRGAYDWNNKSTYSRDLRAALSGAKKLITLWQRKEEELERYQARHAGKELSKKDFYVWAVTLSEFMKFRVDLSVTMVAEWCEMLNKYERYCETANAQQNNILSYGAKNR